MSFNYWFSLTNWQTSGNIAAAAVVHAPGIKLLDEKVKIPKTQLSRHEFKARAKPKATLAMIFYTPLIHFFQSRYGY